MAFVSVALTESQWIMIVRITYGIEMVSFSSFLLRYDTEGASRVSVCDFLQTNMNNESTDYIWHWNGFL